MTLNFMVSIHRFRCNHNTSSSRGNNLTEVRAFCFLLTAPEYFDTRARAVNSIWGRQCNALFFISESSSNTHGLPMAPIANNTLGYGHVTYKVVSALQYAYEYHFHIFEWFVKADDAKQTCNKILFS